MGHFHRTAPMHADQHGEGLSARIAIRITDLVSTMACAATFALIALASLPATLVAARAVPAKTFPAAIVLPGFILIVAWVAQTFLQLVLLSVIMVGQRVQAKATDAQTLHIATGIDEALDRLDVKTAGGLADLRDDLLVAIRDSG